MEQEDRDRNPFGYDGYQESQITSEKSDGIEIPTPQSPNRQKRLRNGKNTNQLKAEMSGIKQQNSELQEKHDELENELRNEKNSKAAEIEELEMRIRALEASELSLEEQNKKTIAELEEQEKKIEETSIKLEKKEEQNQELTGEINSLKKTEEDLNQKLELQQQKIDSQVAIAKEDRAKKANLQRERDNACQLQEELSETIRESNLKLSRLSFVNDNFMVTGFNRQSIKPFVMITLLVSSLAFSGYQLLSFLMRLVSKLYRRSANNDKRV